MKLGVPWTSKGKRPELSARSHGGDTASVHERLDDLTRQIERLSRVTAGKIRPPGAAADAIAREPPPDDGPDPQGRPDPYPEAAAAESPPDSSHVARFAGNRTLNRNPLRPVYADSSFEQTMAEIAARQRALDGERRSGTRRRDHDSERRPSERRRTHAPRPAAPPAQDVSGLEEALRKITTQIESLRRPCPAEDAVPALRQELSEISRSLAEAVPRQAIEAIDAEVRRLAERLDQSRQPGVDTSALTNLEQGLAEVREALRSLKPAESLVGFQNAIQGLSRKIDGIIATQQDPVMLQQLEAAITGLRGIVAHVASDDTLARLTEEVRGIAVRLERTAASAAKPDTLTSLERQIGAIAEAIDASNAQDRQSPAKLETMVREIGEMIEKQHLSRADTIAFGQLEERVAKLLEKLDSSGSRFNHLEAIERGLTDVLVHLEEQRARFGAAMRATGIDPMVDSLKRELDAVNATLNRVVDRLAMIETGIRGGGRQEPAPARPPPATQAVAAPAPTAKSASASPAPAAGSPTPDPSRPLPAPPRATPAAATAVPAKAPILPASSAPEPSAAKSPPSERLAAAQAQRSATQRERPPIDPNLPPDYPLEPGSARATTAQSAAERIAASEAALGPVKPGVIPDPGGKTDFIAAARHAARAAGRPQEMGDKGGSNHSAGAADTASTSLRERFAGRIRSILVGASVFILVVAAVRVAMTLRDPVPPDPLDVQQPSQQRTAAPAARPAPNSTADLASGPTAAGSPRPDQNGPQDTASQAPALAPPPRVDGKQRPVTGAIWPAPSPDQNETVVTGSIAPATDTPEVSPSVPIPPNRPDGQEQPEPKSRLAAAAAAGDPAAAYELAIRHIDGRGVRRSYEDAARLLIRASEKGLAPAQFRLGSLYEKGLGVRKDLNEARRLYAAAAEKGNAKAMHNLAVLYAEGGTAKPDYATAIQWFRKAADRGVADSQYNLGVLFARGIGVEQNLAESYKWFALAAQQGDKEAARKRDDIAARLDAESLMAARLAIKTWTMEPQPEEATTVKAPAGGWDQPVRAPAKSRARSGAPMKLGPG